jgi:hypothetical protein
MERKLLIRDLPIMYEGLFDASELFKLIDDWFSDHGYAKFELKHVERVSEKGRFVNYEIRPFKKISDYVQYEIYVRLTIRNLTETTVKKGKDSFKINKGSVSVSIDAFLATDVKHRWESRPLFFFMRTIFDKFIHREYVGKLEKEIMDDVRSFHGELKGYLNLSRYTSPS